MKKQLHKLLLVLATGIMGTGIYAHDIEVDGIYYNLNVGKRTAEVTYYGDDYSSAKYFGEIEIPSQIKVTEVTYPVTGIGGDAFNGCTGLTSVTIPNSVLNIGNSAFHDCIRLTSAVIPKSVTIIDNWAFANCISLSSVTISNSVTSIGIGAFSECTGLTTITIPSSVTILDEGAFNGCTGFTSIYMKSPTPPLTGNGLFLKVPLSCIIYVPTGAREVYSTSAPWNGFTIEEYNAETGIGSVETAAPTTVGYYDLQGRRLSAPAKGLHIVRYSDGTARKVFGK